MYVVKFSDTLRRLSTALECAEQSSMSLHVINTTDAPYVTLPAALLLCVFLSVHFAWLDLQVYG